LFGAHSYGQIVEPSSGVNKHTLQIEMEAQYAVQKEGNEKNVDWTLPSILFRYGLFKGVELQLNAPLVRAEMYENDHLIHNLNTFEHIQIGASVDLWKQHKLLPEAAIFGRFIVPFEKDLEYNTIGKIIALNFSNVIIEDLLLSYNIGFVHETQNVNSGYYIINLGYNLNPKIHFFVENYADYNKSEIVSQNLNVGLGYNFKENLSLDLSVANGLNHSLFYTGLIFTWALNTKNNKN